MTIYDPSPEVLSNLAKGVTVATHVMQNSSNELSTLVSDTVKMKTNES